MYIWQSCDALGEILPHFTTPMQKLM